MSMTLLLIFMGGAGLAIHFLTRWGDYWRTTEKVGPWTYIQLDPAAWMASMLGSLVFWFALPELDSFLSGLPVGWSLGRTPLGALACGYVGSSIGPKLMAMLAGRAGIR